MPPKRRPKPDSPDQSKRFIDMAREVEAAETKEEAERAFKKIMRTKAQPPETKPR